MDQSTVPDGYMRNAQGHLVPIELVKPIDQERDRLVRELVALAKELNARLVAGKSKMFGDVAAFSFHATKPYHSIEGGLLAFADPRLSSTFDRLKNFGIVSIGKIKPEKNTAGSRSAIVICSACR